MRKNYTGECNQEVKCMLLNFSVKGFKVFYDEVTFSMVANNYIKKCKENLISNLGRDRDINVVKSSFIYGPNNAGKSCFIESLKFFVEIILDGKFNTDSVKNLFYDELQPIEFKIEYIINNNEYLYSLSINGDKVVSESLELNGKLVLNRNEPSNEVKEVFDLIGDDKTKLYIFLLPKKLKFIGDDLKTFIKSFEFVDLDSPIDVNEVLRKENFYKVSDMVSKCDLQIDEIIDNSEQVEDYVKQQADDKKREILSRILNDYKLSSKFTFKGQVERVPLPIINSVGTVKVIKLSYIFLNAIRENKIIIFDEFENSLHTIMAKALISYFNSNNNTKSQLIATTHDLLLLDNDYLLRKDQIWFIYKDVDGNYMYSLDDFKDNNDTDSRGNIMVKYLKGLFGALPMPSILSENEEEK